MDVCSFVRILMNAALCSMVWCGEVDGPFSFMCMDAFDLDRLPIFVSFFPPVFNFEKINKKTQRIC